MKSAIRDINISFTFGEDVNLKSLAKKKNELRRCDQFIVLKYDDPTKATFVVFGSGFVGVQGFEKTSEIIPVLDKFEASLKKTECP